MLGLVLPRVRPRANRSARRIAPRGLSGYTAGMSVGVDFDFARWIAARRGSMEQQAREGAAYAFAGERKFRRTLMIARPVTMALEATTRLWRDVARTELLGTAVKVTDQQYPRVFEAAKAAGAALRVRVPVDLRRADHGLQREGARHRGRAAPDRQPRARREARRHRARRRDRPRARPHPERPHPLRDRAPLPHQLGGVLRALGRPARDHDAAGVVAPRRGHLRSRRAARGPRSRQDALGALVKLELGLDKGSAFNAEEYLKPPPDVKKGVGRYAELFRSHPYVPKRVQALRLFAGSALYAQITGDDPTGKPSLPDIDKQVSDLISVFS